MTILLLTRNRRPWLPYALLCAQCQSYRPTEILVVADGEPVSDLIPPGARLLQLPGHPTIGRKRNLGAAAARGEVIAHWDDDDFSSPDRLARQVARLAETGKAVTGFGSARFTDGSRWWSYSAPRFYVLGSSLCYRRDWWASHPFPNEQVGEDVAFAQTAHRAGRLDSINADGSFWCTNHAGNTSPRNVRLSNYKEL